MPAFTVAYDNAIAVVTFDLPGEPVNKLTAPVIREFEELMTQLRGNAGARAVVFISGNMPNKTEIAPLLIMTRLEQYDYAGATAIAVVMLIVSFALLLVVNRLQAWSGRRAPA